MTTTLQIDPDVKVPAAVKAAAARSEELFNTLRDQPQEEPQTEPITQQGNPELSAASLAAETAPAAEQTPQAEATAEPSETDETWEHKYKSVHGRYVRSQEIIREQAERIGNLERVVATMQAAAPVVPAEEMTFDDSEVALTAEETADYGDDFLKVVGKRARQEIAQIIKPLLQKNAQLEAQIKGLNGVQQLSLKDQLQVKLTEKLPNWKEVNTNPQFLDWLSLPDPYSGAIRHDMLRAAYAQGDSHRVLAFFNGFLAEEAAVAPAKGQPDGSVMEIPKVPLASLAAPGRAKTAASDMAPAEKPIFTRAQIAQFYADVHANKYRGRDADKNRLEAQIFEAQREGRIRN